ncbi:excisionase family DNA-binding protein [Actinosynnema sp. NPDC004786]
MAQPGHCVHAFATPACSLRRKTRKCRPSTRRHHARTGDLCCTTTVVSRSSRDESVPKRPRWMSTKEAAQYVGIYHRTVSRFAADGRLHSHQAVRLGRRLFHAGAVEGWSRGATERQQRELCGCAALNEIK